MQIRLHSKYVEFAAFEQYATQESLQEIKAAAEREYGNCYGLTIDEFWGICNGDLSIIGIDPVQVKDGKFDWAKLTIAQVYWKKRFDDFVQEIAGACKRMTIKPTPEEEQAQNGCVTIEPMEAMLIFVRNYFGLPSFADAGKRTMGEYITARKDDYNQKRVKRNWEEIQRRKLRIKKNKR